MDLQKASDSSSVDESSDSDLEDMKADNKKFSKKDLAVEDDAQVEKIAVHSFYTNIFLRIMNLALSETWTHSLKNGRIVNVP